MFYKTSNVNFHVRIPYNYFIRTCGFEFVEHKSSIYIEGNRSYKRKPKVSGKDFLNK